MKKILSLLSSRKFWLVAIGVFTAVAGDGYGMSREAINNVVQLVSVLVGAIAGVDIASEIKNSKNP